MGSVTKKLRVRALFNYDPSDDKYSPCKEAGLPFRQGDILQIVEQDDDMWWQARREGDTSLRAGLIPSRHLQERIAACQNVTQTDTSTTTSTMNRTRNKLMEKFSPKITNRHRKTKKIVYDALHSEEYDGEEIVTYEEVERYIPPTGQFRPVVLIGPQGVGRRELRRRLEKCDRTLYQSTIPYASRPPKTWEIDGVDCHFVSRDEIEKGIAERSRYVEHSEYRGYLYATDHDDLHSIINQGKIALLSPPPQSLKLLRTAEVRPYVVLVKPPSFDRLKTTRISPPTSPNEEPEERHTNEQFKDILLNAVRLESKYGHVIDCSIVNDDLEDAVDQLRRVIHRCQYEPQWVPGNWVR